MYNFLLGCTIGVIITNLLWYIHEYMTESEDKDADSN